MTEREDTEKRVDDREEEEKRKRCKKEETAIETGLRGEKKDREDKDNKAAQKKERQPGQKKEKRTLRDFLSRTVTPELRKHATVGRSHDQTGSDPSCDPSCDPSRDPAPNPASKQSCDKEREHDLMHAYFCRCNLCYVHDRY